VQLSDTHCHLNFTAFDVDRPQVIERARKAGVTHILNPGVDLGSSRAAVSLTEEHAEIFAAVGVHPNDGAGWQAESLVELRALARHPKVVAIGEIGLDYYRDRTPQDVQKRIFRQQLELAGELGLPVIIHNRQAGEDILVILAEWRQSLSRAGSDLASRPGVLHSFSENLAFAERAAQLNFYIGITGPVTFKNAAELCTTVAGVSVEKLLIETDAPFLTPHPHRGERNEPAHVRFVADKIAEIHKKTPDFIAAATSQNAARLFNW
jgi:TatD DNase family protein